MLFLYDWWMIIGMLEFLTLGILGTRMTSCLICIWGSMSASS
jgi:hypothetical protein